MYHLVVIILILCVNYSICQLVDSSRQFSSLNELLLPNDTDYHGFHEFFTFFDKFCLGRTKPYNVIVFGANAEDLWKTQPLIKNHPYFIYTETTSGGLHPYRLSSNDLVVVFLRDLTKETLENDVEIFSRRIAKRVMLIFDGIIGAKSEISSFVALAIELNIDFPIFAHVDGNVLKFYTHYTGKDCSWEVMSILDWNPGDRFEKVRDMKQRFFRFPSRNRCPAFVITSSFPPKMLLSTTTSKSSVSIQGGRDGKLVLTVAEYLNVTLVIKTPASVDLKIFSEQDYIIQQVANGSADIGIGRLRRVNDENDEFVKYSIACDFECVTWTVPRMMKLSNDIVTVELTWQVWILVGLVFVIGCTTYYYLQKFDFHGDDHKYEKGFFFVFLDVVAIHLGIPASVVPAPLGGKFLLLAFLCYAMVLTTAYKTSLASILVTENGTPAIVDAQGIIDANLMVKGSQYSRKVLQDQAEGDETKMELLKRYEVVNDFRLLSDQLNDRCDTAWLAQASTLNYLQQIYKIKKHESISFDILQSCVLFHETVIIVKKSTLLRKINILIRRLREAGILEQWDKDDKIDIDTILKDQSDELFFENRGGDKFKTVFILYFCGTALSILSFVMELIIYAKSNP